MTNLDALVASVDWQRTFTRLRQWLRWRAPAGLVDDILSEAQFALLRRMQARAPVASWSGFARRVAAGCLRAASIDKQRLRLCSEAVLDSLPARPTNVPLPKVLPRDVANLRLRGKRQRALLNGIVSGQNCVRLAARFQKPLKEARRLVMRLAERVHREREGRNRPSMFHRETQGEHSAPAHATRVACGRAAATQDQGASHG